MDHASEQQMELEALEAIFGEELQIYNGTLPEGWAAAGETYKVVITPADEGEETEEPIDDELQLELLWAHTAEYPETAPCIKVRAGYGLSNSDVASCQRVLMQQVEENLGMAMIYTILTAAKEWLRTRAAEGAEEDPEVMAKKAAAEEEAKRVEARSHGTHVTVEAFMAWKAAFEAEQAAAKAKEAAKEDERSKRLSGKQWFMQDRVEAATEAGALSEEDEEDFEEEDAEYATGEEEEEELDEDDLDYDDDDDEGFLNELAGKD